MSVIACQSERPFQLSDIQSQKDFNKYKFWSQHDNINFVLKKTKLI